MTLRKKDNRQAHRQSLDASSDEADQILHLKRLVVTVKQHYEKSLQQLHIQLQSEQNQRQELQIEFEETQKFYEEEIQSLRQQQSTLKEMLKKAERELRQSGHHSSTNEMEQISSFHQFSFSNENGDQKTEQEMEQLKEELKKAQLSTRILEQKLLETEQSGQKEIERLQQLLDDQKMEEGELETVVSTTSSHYLRRELEMIKSALLDGAKETKALEARYIEMLNEKISVEFHHKQLEQQFEHQSSNLIAFQEQLHDLEKQKKELDLLVQLKEEELTKTAKEKEELFLLIEHLKEIVKEKECIQERYEELKEEWKEMSSRLEETVEIRLQVDEHLNQLEGIAAHQETQLQEFAEELHLLGQIKEGLESDRDQLKGLLEESEERLKVAQQHLAKKVKEAALLSEKLDAQYMNCTDFAQTIEEQKTQITQLRMMVDLHQKQEIKLQDELHEALKNGENQMAKWEEKYFQMYDKWQESERVALELKKYEEKHLQMQSLLANLGNFMGGAPQPSAAPSLEKEGETFLSSAFSFENSSIDPSVPLPFEEKYNLFGMRQPSLKHPHE